MAKPFVLSVSHDLGKEEAKRRLAAGIDYVKANHARIVTIRQGHWDGDRLTFEVATFGQTAAGFVDVGEDRATMTVQLPFLLGVMAEKARSLIRKEGQFLLEKK